MTSKPAAGEIDAQVAEFLERGGKIQKIPIGKTGDTQYDLKGNARKRVHISFNSDRIKQAGKKSSNGET